jgi:hypothetical protein
MLFSRIDLKSLEVERVYENTTNAFDLVLGASHAYAFPLRSQSTAIRSIDLVSGTETLAESIPAQSRARLHPDGDILYFLNSSEATTDDTIKRIDISGGAIQQVPVSWIADDVGHNFWFSSNGNRIFGDETNVFDLIAPLVNNLSYSPYSTLPNLGTLAGISKVVALDHSSTKKLIAVVPRNWAEPDTAMEENLKLFDDTTYLEIEEHALPSFDVDGSSVPTRGRYVFFWVRILSREGEYV